MSCKHGGAAFPQVNLRDYEGLLIPDLQRGMTLRDYFAAKAMQSMILYSEDAADDVASNAYCFADAMLKAREENAD